MLPCRCCGSYGAWFSFSKALLVDSYCRYWWTSKAGTGGQLTSALSTDLLFFGAACI
jgi:hypothetical protein